jgi:hypothetical protein
MKNKLEQKLDAELERVISGKVRVTIEPIEKEIEEETIGVV